MTTTTKQKKPKRRRSPFFFRCCRPKSDLRRLEKISVFPVVLGPLVAPRESEGEREREAVLFSPLFRVKGKKKSAVLVFPFGGACFFLFLLLCYYFIFERGAFENCKENRRTHEKRKRERKRGGGGGGRGLREVKGRNDESSHAAAATSSIHFFYLRRLSACGKQDNYGDWHRALRRRSTAAAPLLSRCGSSRGSTERRRAATSSLRGCRGAEGRR